MKMKLLCFSQSTWSTQIWNRERERGISFRIWFERIHSHTNTSTALKRILALCLLIGYSPLPTEWTNNNNNKYQTEKSLYTNTFIQVNTLDFYFIFIFCERKHRHKSSWRAENERERDRRGNKKKNTDENINLWRAGHHQFFDQWERLNSSRVFVLFFQSLLFSIVSFLLSFNNVCVWFFFRFRYRLSLNFTRNPKMSEWKRSKSQWSMWIHRKWIITLHRFSNTKLHRRQL